MKVKETGRKTHTGNARGNAPNPLAAGLHHTNGLMLGFDCGEFAAVYSPIPSRDNGPRPKGLYTLIFSMPASETMKVPRTIVFIGLMGVGKSCIGRRLAAQLGLGFIDADTEIEAAAGCSIEDIFERHGEIAFRDGERRVIARLLGQPAHVLATGGGSFMDSQTRDTIRKRGISIWLRADLDLLLKRTSRRNNRPLLKRGDPREILEKLMAERHPVYGDADITVDSADGPPEATVERVRTALREYLAAHPDLGAEAGRSAEGACP